MSNSRRTSLSNIDYMLCLSIFVDILNRYDRQREIIPALNQQDEMNRFLHCSEHYRWKGKPSGLLRSTEDVEESNLPHFLDISRTQTR
ncbi:hypothetical protein Tco_0047114 [Tanacetum coccineum]